MNRASVFKKIVTKPLPAGVETFVRKGNWFARWKDTKGRTRTAPLTAAGDRIRVETAKWYARYRDGSGIVRTIPTGCRDERAARGVLHDLEGRAERVRGKLLTPTEAAAIDFQSTPLAEHFDDYLASLEANGASAIHLSYTRRYLDRLAAECGFGRLSDLDRSALERWLTARARQGIAAKTRNIYRGALVAFCNWCLESARLTANPFAVVAVANVEADRRRVRRAMTEAELTRLLASARERPLLEALTVRKGSRKGER